MILKIMELSENEVKALREIVKSEISLSPKSLAKAIGLNQYSIYSIIKKLLDKKLIEYDKRSHIIQLSSSAPAFQFRQLYHAHPRSPLHKILTNQKIALILAMDETLKRPIEISHDAGIPLPSVYRNLKELSNYGIVTRKINNNTVYYLFNHFLWRELASFIKTMSMLIALQAIPQGCELIKDYGDYLLYRCDKQINATKTSFSAYGEYGISLLLKSESNYYTNMPKENLTIRDVFIHSLDSIVDYRHKMYCILFYYKNRNELKGIKHPVLRSIRAVLRRKTVQGYPSYEEVADRISLYEIRS